MDILQKYMAESKRLLNECHKLDDENCKLRLANEEMLAALEPIADLYHAWIADTTGQGHPCVAQYAAGKKPREQLFAGLSLTKEQTLAIVALVAKVKAGAA